MENKEKWTVEGIKKNEKEVWVIDEAGMVNNNLLMSFVKRRKRVTRIVFVGDNKQLQAIAPVVVLII